MVGDRKTEDRMSRPAKRSRGQHILGTPCEQYASIMLRERYPVEVIKADAMLRRCLSGPHC